MSAVSTTPVEIWTDIICHVLYDPVLLRTDPFYAGCNIHAAFREWYDRKPAKWYSEQCAVLRQVSRLWKEIVDLHDRWFFKDDYADGSQAYWKHARRIHLGIYPSKCVCIGHCICQNSGYIVKDQALQTANLRAAIRELSRGPSLPVNVLVLGHQQLSAINEALDEESMAKLFSNLRSLEVIPDWKIMTRAPNLAPTITYLYIGLDDYYGKVLAKFPNLTTLRVQVSHTSSLVLMEDWILPRLQHLEIRGVTSRLSSDEGLFDFIRRGWPLLISLRVILDEDSIVIPWNMWNQLPSIQYFGCSTLRGTDSVTMTLNHSIRTLGLLDYDPFHYGRRALTEIIPRFFGLKVVADFHQWKDVDISQNVNAKHPFLHRRTGISCNKCIMEMRQYCEIHSFRYEDRWGKTLEEFKAGL